MPKELLSELAEEYWNELEATVKGLQEDANYHSKMYNDIVEAYNTKDFDKVKELIHEIRKEQELFDAFPIIRYYWGVAFLYTGEPAKAMDCFRTIHSNYKGEYTQESW